MKTLILTILLGLLLSLSAGAINHSTTYTIAINAAKQRAVKEKKLLVLQFTAKWCLPCRYMEKNVILNESVQKLYEQHAIVIKIDIDEDKSLKNEFNVEVLPTMILMQSTGLVLSRKEESLDAKGFIDWIEKGKMNDYASFEERLNISTQEQFMDEQVILDLPSVDTKDLEAAMQTAPTVAIPVNRTTNYHLQAGIFSNKTNAVNMLNLLKLNFKEDASIVENYVNDEIFFKVKIGQFKTKEEAIQFQKVLIAHNFKAVIRQS